MGSTGRFQGVLEPSRTVGDVDVKADAPEGSIASFPEVRPCPSPPRFVSVDESCVMFVK